MDARDTEETGEAMGHRARTPAEAGWYRLDNAARIYPAIRSRKWSSVFRLSVVLKEPVAPDVLQRALDITMRRFPSFAVQMRAGLFWHFFEKGGGRPLVQPDVSNPCVRMFGGSNGNFLFRVRYHGRRIALEVFHSLTDGFGALTFLKTLTAEYLKLKGHRIPATHGVLDCGESPRPEETEDNFGKYANLRIVKSRRESRAFHIFGTDLPPHNVNIVTGLIPLDRLMAEAKQRQVTLTEYLTGALIWVLYNIQKASDRRRPLPVKVSVPVNMRKFYGSTTLRNFSSYVNAGIDPRYGDYTFDEIVTLVHHFMRYEITEKHLNARLARNVRSERNLFLRVAPLFMKNWALFLAFRLVGERLFTSTLTNLGAVDVPEEMAPHVEYFDMMLGPPRYNRTACAVMGFGGQLCINFTRTIRESYVEREFFCFLVRRGIPVKVFSNQE
jgi:NRPS condensation-like uncharacterized protein